MHMRSIAFRLITAFLCIIVFLIAQWLFAYYNASFIAKTQREAMVREIELKSIKAALADARLTVYKLISTMNPYEMDRLKAQHVQEMRGLTITLGAFGIDRTTVKRNKNLYRQVIDHHYDFSLKTARSLLDTQSAQAHEKLVDLLSSKSDQLKRETQAAIRASNRQSLLTSAALSLTATLFAIFWALVLARSLTDRRRAEEALLEQYNYLHTLIDTIPDPVFSKDRQGFYTGCNRAFEAFTGKKRHDIVGKTVYELGPSEIAEKYRQKDNELFEHPGTQVYEWLLRDKNGNLRNVIFNKAALHDTDGRVTGLVGIISDITERKEAERRLREQEEQLRQSQKMEAIGKLAGGIAHDFNNILSAIIGYAELALDEAPAGSRLNTDIREILNSSMRARDLVKQILAFSRKSPADQKPLSLQKMVREAVRLLRASIPTTIHIDVNLNPDAGTVLADATQMHQVLMNLCTNAAQAMQESGGTLRISLEPAAVNVSENPLPAGEYVRLSVSDTGCGMPPDIIDRIFEPYFTTKEQGRGSGMGLAVVHGIIKNHGGDISVTSRLGSGSCFTVFLPHSGKTADEEHDNKSAMPGGTERILLIDDEETLLRVGQKMLESLGYRVTTIQNSEEALEEIMQHADRYDLVITDQTMPGFTGFDLARRMLAEHPGMPVILCTGYSEAVSPEAAQSAGIKSFIMKPVNKRELARTVRSVLDAAHRSS